MRRHRMACHASVVGCLLLGGTVGWSQAPTLRPRVDLFDRVGVITASEPTAGNITINDTRYVLSPSLRVYVYERTAADATALRAATRLREPHTLRPGTRIGFTVIKEAHEPPGEITEAWLLPPGRLPEIEPPGRGATASTRHQGAGSTQRPYSSH
jgi:hypothetical protein